MTVFGKLGRTVSEFLGEVKGELKKVSFPSRKETMGSTTVVIIFCFLMSLYLSVVDSILVWLVSKVV